MKQPDFDKSVKDEFTKLYNEHQQAVYRLCLVKLKNDEHTAKDCTQNAFVVLYKAMLNKEVIEFPKAFLMKTANNFILKALSLASKEKEKNIPIDSVSEKPDTGGSELESKIDYSILTQNILKILNDEEKELFTLKYIDDLTLRQTAEKLSLTPPAVAKRLQRMREKIKNSVLTGWEGESHDSK